MTKNEAAIVSAFTGILIGNFSEMQRYVEEKLNRPVFTHEFGDSDFVQTVRDISRADFLGITIA
ncbi:MAG: hypothetical protein HOP06_11940 [Methylotenera sp.]|nr:hypothetical protein [Methylotenera sp.]